MKIYWINDQTGIAPCPDNTEQIETLLGSNDDLYYISLITINEMSLKRLTSISHPRFLHFPIPDYGIPSMDKAIDFLKKIPKKHTVFQCMGGIGRSSLMAAAYLMISQNEHADQILEKITVKREHKVPETKEQYEWLKQFEIISKKPSH